MSLISHIVDTQISQLLLRKLIIQHSSHILKQQYQQKQYFSSRLLETRSSVIQILSLINNISSKRYLKTSASPIMTEKSFLPNKALILRKFSRLEYERLCHPKLTDEQLSINVSLYQFYLASLLILTF